MMRTPTMNLAGFSSLGILALVIATGLQGVSSDPVEYINPLIGTAAGGHVFPGPTLPFGMAKAVADTDGDNKGGFDSWASVVTGFSHMHDSGTGGGSSFGNFPVFPFASCPEDDVEQCKFDSNDRAVGWVNETVKASAGYFAIGLENSILAEMTVSNRSALYKFTFPDTQSEKESIASRGAGEDAASKSPLILVELNDLEKSGKDTKASVDPDTGRIIGNGTFSPTFGIGTYDMHFCVDFHDAEVRDSGLREDKYAFVRFRAPTDNKLLVRVGVSFISTDQACGNAEREIEDFDFDDLISIAEKAWGEKMNVIDIKPSGVPKDMEISFWSGLYRTMISPQDYTGENPLWESDEPYYDSFYCIWDSFRTIHPLLTLIDIDSQSKMVRTLVDVYRHLGYLPDCRMSLCKGQTQGGSNADVLLVESYLKEVPGIDWETAYEALIKDAEVQPDNWLVEGRGSLDSWKNLDYIAKDDCTGEGLCTRSISRNVEYAYDDYCIAQIAKELGHTADHEKYTKRSRNWINLFREDQESFINGTDTGFTGFMQPRLLNGSWDYQDPIFCSPLLHPDKCFLNPDGHETYETSAWLYTFYAPHDMDKLIKTLGGTEEFTDRLTYFHESGLMDMGNEPSFLTVFLFHYVGRPGLSAAQAHSYIPSRFNNSASGLPGNDDSGAMGSFLALCMMGLYPVHGQDIYLITPPFFEEVSIRNSVTDKVATIRNVNFDPKHEAIYIQKVTRDGKPWSKNWIGHDFFAKGGVLELVLGKEESKWGTKREDLPFSLPIDE